ncbi:MAG: PTS sugar transporter subunit IIA [Candidatus Brocadia sp. AMX2]|uniref:Phosphotransferase system mannitol/fructose-specific IIA domain n=1 Tax=Candidatus Brocadia sinica JPN1 TaxID=1197129 RepID=A0ABQ0JVE8_9BACT|nr:MULTISPECIES: PTS sugar transporter subunit IIA [Brocadia]KXK30108.1 MAG: putative PTS system component [Candidatus Brocadia sinica]MBC6930821.1 PTS sugar transporter subunit IIA [Candidatus Brocadia sp.]MBL1167790.1 PTS sugar transporter subunit IIA [Candidatus Brocadia sp. AMX1]NOG41404.1 PTS sugar transporter subunit IIA [Planctomycetota bacterium]KAA0245541.1 MAG: PTS sugar transporter subunit IIA [Candidatus Brocadia sp. AMX2]
MKLTDFIVEGAIITEIKAAEKEAVIREMVCSLKDAEKINARDVENIIKSLMKREELGSTGIGKGVAVPHTKHDSVKKIMGTIARSMQGVDFNALDGEPVHLFFLLLSPNDSAGSHLAALERISTVIRDNDFRRFMREANGKEGMIEILHEVDGIQI